MIKLLSKLFIKNRENVGDPTVRRNYGVLCGAVGIVLNLLLSAAKITMGLITGSVSVLADGVNNVSDAGSSTITLLGFRISAKPVDKEHPFGHGRAEYIGGLIVAVAIILVGAELAISSVKSLITPPEITFDLVTLIILGVSVAVKLYMAGYNYIYGKKLSSAALKATGADSVSDAVSTTAVLICALVCYFTGLSLDAYVGLLVSAFIIFSGVKSTLEIVNLLLGTAPDPNFVKEIIAFTKNYPLVRGVHDIVVHSYGVGRTMISLHAEVDAKEDVMEAHDCIDNLEHDLGKKFNCIAVIHMDPVITDDPKVILLKTAVKNIVQSVNPEYSIHDFRMNEGSTHTNVIFDLVLTFDSMKNEKEIVKIITDKVCALNPKYNCVINVDYPLAQM